MLKQKYFLKKEHDEKHASLSLYKKKTQTIKEAKKGKPKKINANSGE